jgi:hypothetical protein
MGAKVSFEYGSRSQLWHGLPMRHEMSILRRTVDFSSSSCATLHCQVQAKQVKGVPYPLAESMVDTYESFVVSIDRKGLKC